MGRRPTFALTDADVLYAERGLLIVRKPPGLAVHATVDPNRPHLSGAVEAWWQRQGGGSVALQHRLDVDTSGLVLFVTDPSLNPAMGRLFAEHAIDKRYRAVVQPLGQAPPDAWRVENFLGRDKARRATRYKAVRSGGKKAITGFAVLERLDDGTVLLEARPVTGRAHQIRVHCAESGWPIVGDRFYGDGVGRRLMLHAHRLVFEHPWGRRVDVIDEGDRRFSRSR